MTYLPKIEVLWAAHNGAEWIVEQFDAILNQKGVVVTKFMSIGASTDHTEKLGFEYSNNNIIVLNAYKCGGITKFFLKLVCDIVSSALDYVWLSDQDDIWHSDKLACAVAQTEQHQLGGYYICAATFWPQAQQSVIVKLQPQRQWGCLFVALSLACTYLFLAASAATFKQSSTKNSLQINRLDFHDWYSYAFARANGYRWLVGTQPSMQYRQHIRNQVGARK